MLGVELGLARELRCALRLDVLGQRHQTPDLSERRGGILIASRARALAEQIRRALELGAGLIRGAHRRGRGPQSLLFASRLRVLALGLLGDRRRIFEQPRALHLEIAQSRRESLGSRQRDLSHSLEHVEAEDPLEDRRALAAGGLEQRLEAPLRQQHRAQERVVVEADQLDDAVVHLARAVELACRRSTRPACASRPDRCPRVASGEPSTPCRRR